MLKSKLAIAVAGIALGTCCVSGLRAQDKFTADKVVAVVGHSAILYSDVEKYGQALVEQRREMGYTSMRDPKCEALEQLIVQKLLYNQSQIDSLKTPMDGIAEAVQSAIDDEIASRGSVAALEMFYHKPIFQIREEMTSRYEEGRYAGDMERSIKDNVKVTPGEVEKYYRNQPKDSLPIIPEQYVYAQIVRYPENQEDAKLRAKGRLLELRERILNGEKFDVLARIYSEDPNTAMQGGEMKGLDKDMLEPPFRDAMVKLKPGQVSGIVETSYGFHLIQLISRTGNKYDVRHILTRPQFTDRDMEKPYDMLDSLRKEIESGKVKFEEAVEKYSEDSFSKENGGIVSTMEILDAQSPGRVDPAEASTKFFKEWLTPQEAKELDKLKPGEVSKPFASQDMKRNILCKIVKLEEILPSHPASLKEDYANIERIALENKQKKVFEEWLKSKVEGMYIRIDKEFRDCDFTYKFLIK